MFRDYYFNLNKTSTLVATIDEDKLITKGVMLVDKPGDCQGSLLHHALGVVQAREVRSAIDYMLKNRAVVSAETDHGDTVRRGKPGPAKMFIYN